MAIFWAFLPLINSLLQFSAFPIQLSKWCLCAFQWGYLNYTIFSFFMWLLLCTFWAKPPSALRSLVYSETKTSCKTGYPLKNPTAYLFQSYAKCPVSGKSDLKATPPCQGGIAVMTSTAPFNCTWLVFVCSLIFGTTTIRTWSYDYSSVVCSLSSSGHQSSGPEDGPRFPSEPGSGSQLEPTHLPDLSLESPYQNESQNRMASGF